MTGESKSGNGEPPDIEDGKGIPPACFERIPKASSLGKSIFYG
jgi:hypothetical protein